MEPFEVVLKQFEPMLKSQMKKLHLYKDFELYYQCACIALWQAYTHYDPNHGPFSTYAISTVRGKLLTELRKQARYEQRFAPMNEVLPVIAHYDNYEKLLEEDIEKLCEHLSSNQQLWLRKAILEGKGPTQIAVEANTTTKSVQSWRREALKKLRTQHKGIR